MAQSSFDETQGSSSQAENVNWRTLPRNEHPSAIEALAWRNGGGGAAAVGAGGPAQGSPQKKNKKGAYNFRRTPEAGGGVGASSPEADAVKRKKYYPRKDQK